MKLLYIKISACASLDPSAGHPAYFLCKRHVNSGSATFGQLVPGIRLGRLARPLAWLLEARKLVLARLPQLLEDGAHLGQLALQLGAGVVIGAPVEFLVDLALELRRLVGGVVAERLGDELDVERGLHERLERVARAAPKGVEEQHARLLEQEGEHLRSERRRRGGELGVDEDEDEQGLVDVRLGGRRARARRRGPVRLRQAGLRHVSQLLDGLLRVRLEEACVNLPEHVADRFRLVRQLDRKGVFKLRVEAGNHLRPESLEVAQSQ